MFPQPPKQHENLFSPMSSRSTTTTSSVSSWHPLGASPSEDMWELPASSSSMSSDDREDFHSSGLHQEFTIYNDNNDYNNCKTNTASTPMPSSVTVRANEHRNNLRRSSSSLSLMSIGSNRGRNSPTGLSEQRCVLGDATNTLRKKGNTSNTRRSVQRSYFDWLLLPLTTPQCTLSQLLYSAPIPSKPWQQCRGRISCRPIFSVWHKTERLFLCKTALFLPFVTITRTTTTLIT